jgi:hypothetical protein
MSDGRIRQLPYGFIFGPATVARLYADRKGVGLEVTTSRDRIHIDVTAAGIIKVRPARRRPPLRVTVV